MHTREEIIHINMLVKLRPDTPDPLGSDMKYMIDSRLFDLWKSGRDMVASACCDANPDMDKDEFIAATEA
jgi:hypothetical protein